VYYYNADSFEKLWRQLCKKTDSNWKIKAEVGDLKTLELEKKDIA